jgi:hypothetical protein
VFKRKNSVKLRLVLGEREKMTINCYRPRGYEPYAGHNLFEHDARLPKATAIISM